MSVQNSKGSLKLDSPIKIQVRSFVCYTCSQFEMFCFWLASEGGRSRFHFSGVLNTVNINLAQFGDVCEGVSLLMREFIVSVAGYLFRCRDYRS